MKNLSLSEGLFSEGVKFMFLSTLSFSLANVFVKQVSHIPAMETVFFRCFFGIIFCLYGLKREGLIGQFGNNYTLLLLRGIFGTAALYFFFVTVQNIPLASAMTIQYLSPIFTSVIAIFLLKESLKAIQWLFYLIAFSGVLLIQQFDFRVSPFFLAIGIFSAFCSGVAYNLVRRLRQTEHPLIVVLHFQMVGAIIGLVFTFFNWKTPSILDLAYLFLIGIFSQLGQIFLTNALQKEKAASVAIVNYTGLIYGLFFGWLIFGESQNLISLAGMLLVVVGVAASVFYDKKKREIEKLEASLA
ncbi:MAG: DMT family transporter [Pyrinomonadaceae bacterium]|nr:DMT family transporter [Pyrinomonadaceae bacterium]